MTVKKINNQFGEKWLENLESSLPTIERLNISNNRLSVDADRKTLFITGHKITGSKGYLGMTKIYCEESDLKIRTTAMLPHILIGFIMPIIAVLWIWPTGKLTAFDLIGISMFSLSPIIFVRDILRQEQFNEEVKKEIELLIPG